MAIVRRIPWTEQPQGGAQPSVDSGLRVLHNPAVGPINLVDARPITYTTGSVFVTQAGLAREALTGSYVTTLSSANSVPAGSDFTVVMVITALTTLTQNAGLFRSATGTDTFALIKTGTGGNYPWVRLAGVNILNAASGAAIPTGRPVTVVVSVRSGSRVDVAWDGAVRHTATHSTATPTFTFSVIGSQGGEYVGPFALFAFSHQALDAAEISSNPWQLFAPRVQRIFAPAASGGAYSITAQPGSYALTGQSSTITRSRLLTASAGSYAYTGQQSTVSRNRQLTASAGSYALSGQSATLARSRLIVASAGAYTYTGQSATLTYVGSGVNYSLTALAGSYALSGQSATLTKSRVINASAGSYSLTGRSATITYSGAPAPGGLSGVYFDVLSGRLLVLRSGI